MEARACWKVSTASHVPPSDFALVPAMHIRRCIRFPLPFPLATGLFPRASACPPWCRAMGPETSTPRHQQKERSQAFSGFKISGAAMNQLKRSQGHGRRAPAAPSWKSAAKNKQEKGIITASEFWTGVKPKSCKLQGLRARPIDGPRALF